MASTINASNSGSGGIVQTADASGVLQLQSAGTTAVTITTAQNVGIGNTSPDRKLYVQTPTAGASLGSNAVVFSDATNATMELKQSTTENQWYSNVLMSFGVNGSTRAAIDTSGKVGIGTTSPTGILNVKGTGGDALPATSGSTQSAGLITRLQQGGGIGSVMDVGGNGGTGSWIQVTEASNLATNYNLMLNPNGGNLLVGATSPVQAGKVTVSFSATSYNGLILSDTNNQASGTYLGFANGSTLIGSVQRVSSTSAVAYNTTSDERLKSNIADSQSVLDKLMTVKVRQYDWTEGQVHQDYGFIAQELEPVFSGIVTKGKTEEDIWQLDYAKLTPHLVKAIQELKTIVDAQAETINALTARVVALESK